MLRLIWAEFIKGYLFIKAFLLALWVLFVDVFYRIIKEIARGDDIDYKSEIVYWVIYILIFLLLSTKGRKYVFGGLRCVPYWGQFFSMKELAQLLEGEEFERVEVPDNPMARNIWESENWVRISHLYFYKPLSVSFFHIPGGGRTNPQKNGYVPLDGHLTYVDGIAFWANCHTNEPEVISDTISRLFCDKEHHVSVFRAQKAFEHIWGDKPYEELKKTDLKLLKEQWVKTAYSGGFRVYEPYVELRKNPDLKKLKEKWIKKWKS